MATRGLFVKRDGAWHEISVPEVKVGNVWTPVRQGFVKVDGVWKHFYPHSSSMACPSAGSYTMQVPPGIYQLTFNAAAGGGGGGTIMDGGYNDDNGSSGGGSSGQMVRGFSVAVTPGETVTVNVGAGGSPGPANRDGNDTGAPGADTTISCASGTYVLRGGNGGGGGSPAGGGNFPGGTYVRVNSGIPNIFGHDGTTRYGLVIGSVYYGTVGGAGGAGYDGYIANGTNNSTGNAGRLGGGGSGVYSGYLRQDRGIPGFLGGRGGDGFAEILWGPGVDPNYPA